MDVLSEVLKAVKLDGAVFFHGEFAAPWCAREPDAGTMASYLPTQAGHIIIFHLLLEGRGYIRPILIQNRIRFLGKKQQFHPLVAICL